MQEITGTITTTIINSDDGRRNFEIRRRIDTAGDKAIIVSLYPSISGISPYQFDSTALHLMNHILELGLCEIRILNLFSGIIRGGKMSTKSLEIDKENLTYIETVMQASDFSDYRFVIAWGSSMSTSKAACRTKELIIEMYRKYMPKGELYQIVPTERVNFSPDATHPLFLGIRAGNTEWSLAGYIPKDSYMPKHKDTPNPLNIKDNNDSSAELALMDAPAKPSLTPSKKPKAITRKMGKGDNKDVL